MAHFYNWDTKQAVSTLYVIKGQENRAIIGLYGGYVDGNWLDVWQTSRSGSKARLAEETSKRVGYTYQAFKLEAVSEGDVITATRADGGLFAEPVTVVIVPGSNNAVALHSGDPWNVFNDADYTLEHKAPQVFALEHSWRSQRMGFIHGLAVHTTAGLNNYLQDYRKFWDDKGTSAHFVINRSGQIAQYVALSYQAWAQGPGNPFWISVEIVNAPDHFGKGAPMLEPQLKATALLFNWLSKRYGFPLVLAAPYLDAQKNLGNVYTDYQALAQGLSDANRDCGSTTPTGCIFSRGLSCHQWLQPNVKPCPGYEIIDQLPEIVRRSGGSASDREVFAP
jgi:N-acetylmuramoyl-L-alanine amidase-like protein